METDKIKESAEEKIKESADKFKKSIDSIKIVPIVIEFAVGIIIGCIIFLVLKSQGKL